MSNGRHKRATLWAIGQSLRLFGPILTVPPWLVGDVASASSYCLCSDLGGSGSYCHRYVNIFHVLAMVGSNSAELSVYAPEESLKFRSLKNSYLYKENKTGYYSGYSLVGNFDMLQCWKRMRNSKFRKTL